VTFVTAYRVSEELDAVKNKEPVARNKMHSSKSCLSRNLETVLVKKQSGIQLKSGSVFCLPAKSSYSSRIIIPNKRFLEDDYHTVEILPKKSKVSPLSADAKKASTLPVPSTYNCPLGAKKQSKSDNRETASDVVCKHDAMAERGPCESESTPVKDSTSAVVDKQDTTLTVNNNKPETASVQAADGESLKTKFTTESVSMTSSCDIVALTGSSILQRPKLCLDQNAVDRSKLAFADSLRNQIAEESQPDISASSLAVEAYTCSSSAIGDTSNSDVCSITASAPCSNNVPSATYRNWNLGTGKCCTLYTVLFVSIVSYFVSFWLRCPCHLIYYYYFLLLLFFLPHVV